MELVAREMADNKDEFEWHKTICRVNQNLKQIEKNLSEILGVKNENKNC